MINIQADELVKSAHQAVLVGGTMLGQMPDLPENVPFAKEWKTFKREVTRLTQEGHTGKFAAFNGNRIVGIWGTLEEAVRAAYEQSQNEPCLVQEIQLYLKPMRWGYRRLQL